MSRLSQKIRLALAGYARSHRAFRGRHLLLRTTDRWLRRLNGEVLEEKITGVAFRLDTEDLIDFNLLYRGLHQSDLVDYLSYRLGTASRIFWDIGANVGSISLRLALRNPNLVIHGFEPSPPVFARLRANVACNPDLQPRINLHHLAIAGESGKVRFFVSNETFNSGVGGLQPAQNRAATPVEVTAARGDDLITSGRVPAPSLIKIDVEGFEVEVLSGLAGFLRASDDVEVVFEHEPYRLKERTLGQRAVIDYLQSLGFEVRQMLDPKAGTTGRLEARTLEQSCDLVARKRF